MKTSNTEGMSKEQSDAIFGQIARLAKETFCNMDLSSDLVKAAQMLLLKISLSQNPPEITQDFVTNFLFPKAVNSVFGGYQKDCFRFSLSKTQDGYLSDDIAQEAIKLLLLSKKKIKSISAWLIQVTYNLLCAHYEKVKKDKELYQKLSLEASSYEKWLKSEDLMGLKELDHTMVEEILKSDEYREYQKIISFNSIKDYAAAHNIGEKSAQKKKNIALRNLKSMVLLGLGWRDTPEILDYNQYYAIRKFIIEVQRMLSGDEEIEWLKSLSPEQAETVKSITKIADWGISEMGERNFRLSLFTLLENRQPFLLTFHIILSMRNSISIQSCKVNEHAATLTAPANVRVPKNRGRVSWTYEEIITLLRKIE